MPWGRVLMIDEDAVFRRLVSEYLAREGVELVSTSRADMFALGEAEHSDIVILSRSIAEENIDYLLNSIRSDSIPMILISAAGDYRTAELTDMVKCELEKPFDIAMLYEQLLTLLPLGGAPIAEHSEYKGLKVDLATGTVQVDGEMVNVSSKEAQILHLLISYPNRVFSREEIASRVWGRILADDRTVSVHVNHIRNKIGSYAENIIAVRGAGYKFRE